MTLATIMTQTGSNVFLSANKMFIMFIMFVYIYMNVEEDSECLKRLFQNVISDQSTGSLRAPHSNYLISSTTITSSSRHF